jgi:hypothetical protein
VEEHADGNSHASSCIARARRGLLALGIPTSRHRSARSVSRC